MSIKDEHVILEDTQAQKFATNFRVKTKGRFSSDRNMLNLVKTSAELSQKEFKRSIADNETLRKSFEKVDAADMRLLS